MKKLLIVFCCLLFTSFIGSRAEGRCLWSYDESILSGHICVDESIEPFDFVFRVTNNTKTAINFKILSYRVEMEDGSIYVLENPRVVGNDGIAGSYILNPKQVIAVYATSPFSRKEELEKVKEVYIRHGDKRIFFVLESEIDEYKKPENIAIRHLRNLWWNIK
ncbi:MAG: hypothetical protein PHY73_05470 [Candidatus Omnitrophica bacterium]|nr:hypothetical protein [Candidatus Omnitrophota bacterium]